MIPIKRFSRTTYYVPGIGSFVFSENNFRWLSLSFGSSTFSSWWGFRSCDLRRMPTVFQNKQLEQISQRICIWKMVGFRFVNYKRKTNLEMSTRGRTAAGTKVRFLGRILIRFFSRPRRFLIRIRTILRSSSSLDREKQLTSSSNQLILKSESKALEAIFTFCGFKG